MNLTADIKRSSQKQTACLFLGIMVAALFLPSSPVWAVPTSTVDLQTQIQSKLAELERVKAELAVLDDELEITIEAYNKARYDLDQTEQDLATTKADLDQIEATLDELKEQFAERIRSIYKQGDLQIIEVLLNTSSFADFLSRVSFLMRISEQDAAQVKALQETRLEVEKQKMRLEELRSEQMAIEWELDMRKTDIQQKLLERQQFMTGLDAELQELIRQELERQARLQTDLQAQVAELIRTGKIKVQPGSIVYTALKYLGVPYVWGGATPLGFDCSGLVLYVFAEHGVTLPHYSGAQFQLGKAVPREWLEPGDLVFFGTPVHHVGIYIGGGYFEHASSAYDYVRIDLLSDRNDYAGARRIPVLLPTTSVPSVTTP